MNRRNALKLMGALVACIGGYSAPAESSDLEALTGTAKVDDSLLTINVKSEPVDYIFHVDTIKDIVFRRPDKPDLVIPFVDIIKALEED